MSLEKRANAIDHSHHLSDYARRYNPSYLKGLQKYYRNDLIPFAGGAPIYPFPHGAFTSISLHHYLPVAGLPSPEYFPFSSISADILPTDAFPLSTSPGPQAASSASPLGWLWRRLFGLGNDDEDTTRIRVPREPREGDGGLNLATALQYGPATGLARTQAFIREFTERIYGPAYADWATLIDTGNTDGCGRSSFYLSVKVVLLACAAWCTAHADLHVVEGFTFVAADESWQMESHLQAVAQLWGHRPC